jgi:anaerobic dimethyl sulfoxide reductase subunit C
MNNNEWPLVFFTLLSQISTGILLAGLVVFVLMRNQIGAGHVELKRLVVFTALVIMAIALLLSFLHLAKPQHAVFALQNVRASYLSREIFLVTLFFMLLLAAWSSLRFGFVAPRMFSYFYFAAIVAGMFMIWTMARLYMVPTVPPWNTPITLLQFFNSSLLLGAAAFLLITATTKTGAPAVEWRPQVFTILFTMIAVGVFIHLLTIVIPLPAGESAASGFPLPEIPAWIKISRAALLLFGFIALLWWFNIPKSPIQPANQLPLIAGVLLLILAEIAGRYIFYANYYRVGV